MESGLPDYQNITYEHQIRLLRQSLSIWKIIVYFAAVSLVTMVALGFAFQIIFFGIAIGFWQMALIYDPAYRLFVRLFRLTRLPEHLAKPQTWYLVFSWLMLVAPLLVILFGIGILYFAGMCTQNIVCFMAEAMRR